MKHPQSPLASRCSAYPLKGAEGRGSKPACAGLDGPKRRCLWRRRGLQGSPVTGETPATAIAGLACSAAIWLFRFQAMRSVLDADLRAHKPTKGAIGALFAWCAEPRQAGK